MLRLLLDALLPFWHFPPAVHWKRFGNGWGFFRQSLGRLFVSALEKEWRLWAASARRIRSVGGARANLV
eukprot:802363-Pyramimonas_sp.AAC.1